MSLPKNLKLTDLILKEPVDFKAPGQPDEIKYRRHRRRVGVGGNDESVKFTVNGVTKSIDPFNLKREDLKFLKQMSKADLGEALSMMQRLRRGRLLKRIKSKLKRGSRMARRRVASLAVLTKRARRAARNLILTRLTKGKKKGDLPFSRRSELERRLEKPAIANRLKMIAKRLIPQMRKKEQERRKSAQQK